jgi:hypothetical protein
LGADVALRCVTFSWELELFCAFSEERKLSTKWV